MYKITEARSFSFLKPAKAIAAAAEQRVRQEEVAEFEAQLRTEDEDFEGEEREGDDAEFYNYGGDGSSSQYDVNRDAEIMGYQGPDYDTNVPPRGSGGYDNGNFY